MFAEQDRVAVNETSSPAYTLVSLHADYHVNLPGDGELTLFAEGRNLLDEDIRNHTSFLKTFTPDAGRAIELGIRLNF